MQHFGFSKFRHFFLCELDLDRRIHICSYVELYMDRTIHIFYSPGNIWILDFSYFLIILRTFFNGGLGRAGGRGGPGIGGSGDRGSGAGGGGANGDNPPYRWVNPVSPGQVQTRSPPGTFLTSK